MDFFKGSFNFLWRNKGVIGLIPLLMLAWVPLIFPYSDLRSVVATTVSRAMGDGFAIDFSHVAIVPGLPLAVALEGFEFNGPGLPLIAADRVAASPSILSIFTRAPAGSIDAEGMFKGTISASLASGATTKNGDRRQDIKAIISGVHLGLLTDALRRAGIVPVSVQGTLDTTGTASYDPLFNEQPDGDAFVQLKSVSIPSIPIALGAFGSLVTPSLQLGRVDFKGKLSEGKIVIEDFSFGQATDALNGRVRGEIGLTIQKGTEPGSRTRTATGPYDLTVEFTIAKPLMDAMIKSGAALPLALVEDFKKTNGNMTKFAFGVKGASFGPPPQYYGLKSTN
jgi:type II secretion system protein N